MKIECTVTVVIHCCCRGSGAPCPTPAPDDWIGTAEVARMLNVTQRHVADYLCTIAAFPKPIRPPTAGKGKGHMKWPRSAIQAYKDQLGERKNPLGGRPRRREGV